LDPAHGEAILARGRLVGFDRVMGGVHYPSDVEAGQRLGEALAGVWLQDPARRQRVEEVRAAEWRGFSPTGK
jgi:acid phosphatase (class A)